MKKSDNPHNQRKKSQNYKIHKKNKKAIKKLFCFRFHYIMCI